ncbi:hypothetical protein B0T24DRAFT_581750 [Lasiosphaeria ovina]|uniref:ubiquitinyl hydrolase 1 n=1 Tax=Lasiosphaeria ovina TaxID=92902 RepID=A0AAE0JZD8_9PEZI|nr:hypothetical protein B0T24DRAFT_581750 [Lasiosphaeria ovina]
MALEYMINHVFLPPRLPQEGGEDGGELGFGLVQKLRSSVAQFAQIEPDSSPSMDRVVELLDRFVKTVPGGAGAVGDQKAVLRGTIAGLNDGGSALFHLRGQNAGLLLSKGNDGVLFEAWELLAPNEAATSATGSLLREFPDRAALVPIGRAQGPDFLDQFADVVLELTTTIAAAARPKSIKAGGERPEERDTMSPILATGLAMDVLAGLGTEVQPQRATKRSREQVCWKNAFLPFHRSPLWLLLRVALRLVLDRSAAGTSQPSWYKPLMAYHHAHILDAAIQETQPAISSDLIKCMKAKLVRRITKLDPAEETGWIRHAGAVALEAQSILATRWEDVQDAFRKMLPLEGLARLSFDQDSALDIYPLRNHLRWIDQRPISERKPRGQGDISRLNFWDPTSKSPPKLSKPPPINTAICRAELFAFEEWVASNSGLPRWLQHQMSEVRIRELGGMLLGYLRQARGTYADIPEALSKMYLIALEIWVAVDKLAGSSVPLLLDYDPMIPPEAFKSLLLETKDAMRRLREAEDYLTTRKQNAAYPNISAFRHFGHKHSFAVRLFDSDSLYQTMYQEIEKRADQGEKNKKLELERQKIQCDRLAQYVRYTICSTDPSGEHDPKKCQRCITEESLKNRRITVFERPLPDDENQAKAIVVEIAIPTIVQLWRNITWNLVTKVFRKSRDEGLDIRNKALPKTWAAKNHSGLSNWSTWTKTENSICIASDIKFVEVSHYRQIRIPEATPENVCVPHGAIYEYYEEVPGQASSGLRTSAYFSKDPNGRGNVGVPNKCSYADLVVRLRGDDDEVEDDLYSLASWVRSAGYNANKTITGQGDRPRDMAVEEFRAFAIVRSEVGLQWANVLCQLAVPSVGMNKYETFTLMLQACLEVGPRNGINYDSIFRQAHCDTQHATFMGRILEAMNIALDRVQESWQNDVAVSILVCLATRLLSLSPSHVISAGLLEFLGKVRRVSIGWARLLLDKRNRGNNQGRKEAASWLLVAALICAATFNIGAEHLGSVLEDPDNLALLAECSMLAQNHLPGQVDDLLALQLVHRWRKALFDARTIIVDEVIDAKNGGLDIAIKEIWADHSPPSAGWKQANNHDQAHILVCDNGRFAISFNVLMGNLMVDGYYIQALPRDWRSTHTYKRLFGQLNVEVGPSSLPGMQFSTSHNVSGCIVHFAMVGNTLVVRATEQSKSGSGGEVQVWEYIAGGHFGDYLPHIFVDGYAHWLNLTTKEIEFRDIDDKWTTSADNWRLSTMPSGQYRLAKGPCLVMDPRKPTAEHIALNILGSIENELDISCMFDTNTRTLTVDLPRMGLSFCAQEGQGFLKSRNYTGMRVDEDQEVGTLIGLKNKLVLKPDGGGGPRQVLIPRGDVLPEYFERDNAVQVSIGRGLTQAFVCHDAYVVDDKLGCLIDSGSLQSKLYLCLLHASTSHCLPDPLTRRTGTEEALRILKGAAIVSYPSLDIESGKLLGSIGRLSPRRVYYPDYLKVMESTTWDDNLPSLSQHDDFRILAKSICSKYDMLEKIFTPPHHAEDDDGNGNMTKGTTAFYCERARIRNAIFRVAEFGADAHTRGAVANKEYRPLRDRETPAVGSYSKRILVQKLARCILSSDEELMFAPMNPVDLQRRILRANGEHVFDGPNADLTFDLRNLNPAETCLPGHWSEWHRALASEPNIYRKIFFLATLLYAKEWDEELVQILMAIGSSGILSNHPPPNEPVKDLDSRTWNLRAVLKGVIGNKQKPPPSSFHPARLTRESNKQYDARRRNMWKQQAVTPGTRLLEVLITQASSPTGTLNIPPHSNISQSYDKYLELPAIMREAQAVVQDRRAAKLFHTYVVDITEFLQGIPVIATQTQFMPPIWNAIASAPPLKPGYISVERLFRKHRAPENQIRPQPESFPQLCAQVDVAESGLNHDQLSALVDKLSASPGDLQDYQLSYINELRDSIREAKSGTPRYMVTVDRDDPDILPVVHRHLEDARGHYHAIYEEMRLALTEGISIAFQLGARAGCYPRISTRFLIQQLRHGLRQSVPKEWRSCLINLALSLVYLQRAERLASYAANLPQRWGEFGREMANRGDHSNEDWDLLEYPEGLLLEIEQNIMIRPVQNKIAATMRSPPDNKNAVMQLNMGEGKSSVIVPIVTAALATKKKDKIVRLVVAKPQASQMQHMMISRLGGLMNRRIFHLPFSRSTSLGASSRRHIRDLIKACKEDGGLFFMQPEHLLSFKLLGIDRTWASNGQEREMEREANAVIRLWNDFEDCSRDMVDESDENFNVRFELVYSMGNPQPVEMSPNRWLHVQDLLAIVETVTRELMLASESVPDVAEGLLLKDYGAGSVPLIRVLSGSAAQRILKAVAERVCRVGLKGFPIHFQTVEMRAAVLNYILLDNVSASDIAIVEDSDNLDFFANVEIKNTLFLLRGLFAKGILLFALGEKRYRVNYGLAPDRNPPTLLAVPYRAKDMPSPRSEFSHPDVVIMLTCLSYYYNGLSNDSLATCLELLEKSENPDDEYSRWVKASPNLPRTFGFFSSINMKDVSQCVDIVFPNLRYARPLIDFYLAKVVFPKEMKEFKYKLSASGWDLARPKRYPLTGFSGTNDSKGVLPLSVTALDLQPQTNANVLSTLLRDENTVLEPGGDMTGAAQLSPLTENMLLSAVTNSDPPIRVILDVGAQIVECSNFVMAERLLWSVPDSDADAVIFFNWRGEMSVLTRNSNVAPFLTSPFASNTDRCLVFLDQAHTRGTDLKLPANYRAAVTLGPGVTKDTLVQACMRMRQLGQGQSVCFIVSPEMQKRIRTVCHIEQGQPLSVSDVLGWAISGAWDETARSVPLWATQGVRHLRQEAIWRSVELAEWDFDLDDAEDYVEPEAMSLKERYRPDPAASTDSLIVDDVSDSDEEQLSLIKAKLASFALSTGSAAAASALNQEREQEQEQEMQIENEVEEEREGHNAPPLEAANPVLATDLIKFVKTGEFVHGSAYRRPFSALRNTSANALFPGGLRKFPHVPGFWATGDFMQIVDEMASKTVKAKGSKDFVADSYLRDVQWVLFRHEDPVIVIISPFEAQRVKPMILNKFTEMQRDAAMQRPSSSGEDTPILPPVTLHALLARASPVLQSATDMRACTFPLSVADDVPDIPAHLLTQLNLFAGHRYLRNYDQYVALCTWLGLSHDSSQTAASPAAPDGFIGGPDCLFTVSPVPFLAELYRIRRNFAASGLDRSHMGRILAGEALTREDFEVPPAQTRGGADDKDTSMLYLDSDDNQDCSEDDDIGDTSMMDRSYHEDDDDDVADTSMMDQGAQEEHADDDSKMMDLD